MSDYFELAKSITGLHVKDLFNGRISEVTRLQDELTKMKSQLFKAKSQKQELLERFEQTAVALDTAIVQLALSIRNTEIVLGEMK
jgi:uncharacterized membrane-anchored protein YhcB (DUF1043 family)